MAVMVDARYISYRGKFEIGTHAAFNTKFSSRVLPIAHASKWRKPGRKRNCTAVLVSFSHFLVEFK